MVTIENIKKDLEQMVEKHPQLESFGFGDIDNINTNDYTFPMVWMQLTPGTYNNNHEVIKADLYVMDVLMQDLSNEVKVFSSTNIYANDIIGYLIDNSGALQYDTTKTGISKEPFSAKYDHHVNGFVFNLELKTSIGYCTDATPLI